VQTKDIRFPIMRVQRVPFNFVFWEMERNRKNVFEFSAGGEK
jgi:hypothetical protein